MIKRIWLALRGNKFARARLFTKRTAKVKETQSQYIDRLRKAGL